MLVLFLKVCYLRYYPTYNYFKYYSHKNNRWDLYFKNNILIKLPEKNYIIALKIYRQFAANNKIKPNTVLDLRISNRLTVKSE
mgnify:CR=1 FL=1